MYTGAPLRCIRCVEGMVLRACSLQVRGRHGALAVAVGGERGLGGLGYYALELVDGLAGLVGRAVLLRLIVRVLRGALALAESGEGLQEAELPLSLDGHSSLLPAGLVVTHEQCHATRDDVVAHGLGVLPSNLVHHPRIAQKALVVLCGLEHVPHRPLGPSGHARPRAVQVQMHRLHAMLHPHLRPAAGADIAELVASPELHLIAEMDADDPPVGRDCLRAIQLESEEHAAPAEVGKVVHG